jgi:hypothetical protein
MNITSVSVPSITKEEKVRATVSLSDFKPEEVAEWLRSEGYQVDGTFRKVLTAPPVVTSTRHKPWCALNRSSCECGGDEEIDGVLIEQGQLSRVETLLLCGQRDAAREHVLALVGEAIGRVL